MMNNSAPVHCSAWRLDLICAFLPSKKWRISIGPDNHTSDYRDGSKSSLKKHTSDEKKNIFRLKNLYLP